jgi:hypothetical protein
MATVRALLEAGADCTNRNQVLLARCIWLGLINVFPTHSICGFEQNGKTAASLTNKREIKELFPKGTFVMLFLSGPVHSNTNVFIL